MLTPRQEKAVADIRKRHQARRKKRLANILYVGIKPGRRNSPNADVGVLLRILDGILERQESK